jgi:hypothetical protein
LDFAFQPELANIGKDRDVELIAQAEDGSAVPAPEPRWSRGLLHVLPRSESAFKYRIRQVSRPRSPMLTCGDYLVQPAGTVEIGVSGDMAINARQVIWHYDGHKVDGKATRSGNMLVCQAPPDIKSGEHVWLSIGQASDALWLDFIIE